MPETAGTLQALAAQFAEVLQPIAAYLSDDNVLDTFEEFGVRFPDQFKTDPQITPARTAITDSAKKLAPLTRALMTAVSAGNAGAMTSAALDLIRACGDVVSGFGGLTSAIQTTGPGLPGMSGPLITGLVADLPRKLLDLLLAETLELDRATGVALAALGVITRTPVPPNPDPAATAHEALFVHLDRLLPAVSNPIGQLGKLYGWGGAGFDPSSLFAALAEAIGRLGIPTLFTPPGGGSPAELHVFALTLRPTTTGSPPGLDLDFIMPVGATVATDVPVSPGWTLHVAGHGALAAGTTGTLRPPFDITLTPPSGAVDAALTVSLRSDTVKPVVVLGEAGGSRLEFAKLVLEGVVAFTAASGSATATPGADGEITGGRLVIDASRGDGFLTAVLGGLHLDSSFGVGFGLDPTHGLRFRGSGGLQIHLPVHVQFGPVDIQSLYLILDVSGPTIPIELSAGFAAHLGPLTASVDRLGTIVHLGFPPGGGNLGPAQLDFSFKPPTGVGLSIDAGIVAGGGYLSFDSGRGEYYGAIQLRFAGFLTLSAVGLIDTRLPDGSPGFSLLIIITADFGAGIQLGFGFTLLAVGGLLGVNRGMLLQPIMDGVRSGAIGSVMFPGDVVANAPRIISDLKAFFPPRPGTFLIGPMAKLGWGEPTLVSLSLGVIVEVPPGDIAILGVLRVALPADELEILVLNVNFAGALEFSKQRLYFFASLYDSHVLFITIDGEIGVLFAWGSQADFVLSVGGFHPRFTPPPLPFPAPRRISVSIINESYARIRADGYFAVTTNTVQFGTNSEYFFGFDALSVSGHSGFDALIQFSPFHFSVSVRTAFSVKVFGIGVYGVGIDLTVEGPGRWHAYGSASLSFFFFSVDIPIDVHFGSEGDTTLKPVDVLPILTGELGKRSNWLAVPPRGAQLSVTLRALDPAVADLVLHPLGTLQVAQKAVPLDVKLDKFGNTACKDGNLFRLAASGGFTKVRDISEPFAPAGFRNLDDAGRLSQPAFVPQDGGIELAAGGGEYRTGTTVTRHVRYNITIVDTRAPKVGLR
ncbi:MAG TPA: DUF6603 domain-containing protein, partial [Kineosporiaceae bacterium]